MTDDVAAAALAQFKRALASRDRASINQAARELIRLKAPLGKTWRSVATVLEKNGEHDDSFAALAVWSDQAGHVPMVLFDQAGFHARAGRHRESEAFLARIPPNMWDPVGLAYLRGTLATSFGETAEAIAQLRKAVDLDPTSGQSWLALAMAGGIDEDFADRLEESKHFFAERPAAESTAYYYALGRTHHHAKRHEAAFDAFSRGAAMMRRERPYDRAAHEQQAEQAMAGWTPERVAEFNRAASGPAARQIVVTGLPRSGTTLTEQILASHSAVDEGGELNLMGHLQQDIGGTSLAQLDSFLGAGGTVAELRALHAHLLDQRLPGNRRAIDKTVPMSRSIGLIAALFPDAPIIWLRRDPADCAWSIFSTFFLGGISWSWALDDIAHFYNLEDRLLNHWLALLGDRILVVPYADLVTDPADWIARIDRHAGLKLEQAQLTPHLEKRVVATASASQVREPINRKGIASSAPYHRFMAPFFENYRGGVAGI